jgi:hypothetical protein
VLVIPKRRGRVDSRPRDMGLRRLFFFAIVVVSLTSAFTVNACGDDDDAPSQGASVSVARVSTAEESVAALKERGLPVSNVKVYDSSTDPNDLLGRPNGYKSKVNFQDARLGGDPDDFDTENGGSVEFFGSESSATARRKYIEEIGKSLPVLTEYDYQNGPVLLRLSKKLTPEQAKEYEKAFGELRPK